MSKKPETVMAFGVFDLIHDGHRYFLRTAKKLGRLVVVVAMDASVQKLKNAPPRHPLRKRMENLAAEGLALEIIAGDEVLGSWKALRRLTPDIIALGYDQKALGETLQNLIALEKLPTKIVFIGPYKGKSLHSSILGKKI